MARRRHRRLVHWSRPVSAAGVGVLVAVFSIGLVGQPARVWIVVAVIACAVELLCLRICASGATYDPNFLRIRSPFRTRRVAWSDIRDFEVSGRDQGARIEATTRDGRAIHVWGIEPGGWFPTSSTWLARAILELRSWQLEAKGAYP
jgi:hypothetical protein